LIIRRGQKKFVHQRRKSGDQYRAGLFHPFPGFLTSFGSHRTAGPEQHAHLKPLLPGVQNGLEHTDIESQPGDP
jgi:hypothetical protein